VELSEAEHIGIISLPLRYNAARERCQCDGRRCAAKTTLTCVFPARLLGWAAFDMRMMFQGYLERGFVAEDGDTETLTKLLGHPPRRYRALQGRQPKRGNPKQNRFSVNLLREKGGRVVKPGNRLDKRHTHLF
jgi:hypothetical protein